MRIGINTLSVTSSRGGAKTYLINLVKALAKIDHKNDYLIFVTSKNRHLFDIDSPNFHIIEVPLISENRGLRVMFEQVALPLYLWKYGIDVFFSPGNSALLSPTVKHQVMVVHGPLVVRKLRERYAPNELRKLDALYYDALLPRFINRADKVIAVSHNFRQWLLDEVPIDESKVRVIHEGVDAELFQQTEKTSSMDLPKPYILFLSTLFHYKNANKAIQAFALVKKRYGIPHELVIGGRDPGGRVAELRKLSEEQGVADSVRFLGQVPFELVPDLYKHADIFLYPSTVESFGLPPLEAMACGTPVIGSNRCSVPEVIGDAGLIVDPDNIEEMAEAIWRLLHDQELRNRLVQKGYERVNMFTWERSAKETLGVFEELFAENRDERDV